MTRFLVAAAALAAMWLSSAVAAPLGDLPYSALPNCTDTAGQHLNVTAATGAMTCGTSSSASGANPTASIGMAAVNGSASTLMRSDGAPAIGANAVTNAGLAQAAANTLKGNATGSTANLTDMAVTSCSTASSILQWLSGTGFQCGTTVNVQTFTSSGTWTKPYTTGTVEAHLFSQGGCGAGGAMEPSLTIATGGGAGGGGDHVRKKYLASDFSGNISVTIGTNCTGGLGATSNGAGSNGSAVGASATWGVTPNVVAYGGGSGAGGGNATNAGAGGGAGNGGAGGNASGASNGSAGTQNFAFGAGVAGDGGNQTVTPAMPSYMSSPGGGGGAAFTTAVDPGGHAMECPGGGAGGTLLVGGTGTSGGTGGGSAISNQTGGLGGTSAATGNTGASVTAPSSLEGGGAPGGGGAGTAGNGGDAGTSTARCAGGSGGGGGTARGGNGSAAAGAIVIVISRP